jgi:hypothetical protein
LLRITHQVLGNPLALPMASVLSAGGAVLLFLFRSPFSGGLKLLFVFGVLPLYEYSVMARNYGISMLLMFGFAALYPRRQQYALLLALVLALLANTNVHSLLIAGVLTCLWLWDETMVGRQGWTAHRLGLLGLAAGLILAAALFALKTTLPDERTVVTSVHHATSLDDYLRPFGRSLRAPWRTMDELMPFPDWIFHGRPGRALQYLLIGALVLGLAVQARLALALLATLVAFGFLFQFVYPGVLRHQGLLLIFALTLYWMNIETGPPVRKNLSARLNTFALLIALPLLLLWTDYYALYKVRQDFRFELSSSAALGKWFRNHPQYREAIILGEPDYFLEALPYYVPQRIFIPRESRFGAWVHFTTEATPVMSLGHLLEVAQMVKAREHQDVFLALGFPTQDFEKSGFKKYPYNKVLTWTPLEWQAFRQHTILMAQFWSSLGDENFDLYKLQ